MATRQYAEIAYQYAHDVLEGEVVACELVKNACKRFIDDIERDDWVWTFDAGKANRACAFMELLPHTKGKWAAERKLLVLESWQIFIECNIFGFVH